MSLNWVTPPPFVTLFTTFSNPLHFLPPMLFLNNPLRWQLHRNVSEMHCAIEKTITLLKLCRQRFFFQLSLGVAQLFHELQLQMLLNPFVPNAPFFYPLKTSGKLTFSWCFQGVERGCIENKWVNTCKHRHNGTHFILTLFMSMSRPRSIYIVSMRPIFHFIFVFIMINRTISWIQTHLFFCLFFRICPIIFEW